MVSQVCLPPWCQCQAPGDLCPRTPEQPDSPECLLLREGASLNPSSATMRPQASP